MVTKMGPDDDTFEIRWIELGGVECAREGWMDIKRGITRRKKEKDGK